MISSSFLERYAQSFGRNQALMLRMAGLTSAEVFAENVWVTDSKGDRWMDFGSFGIHLLGHRHPRVLAALTGQLSLMGLSTKILGNEKIIDAAEGLLKMVGGGKDKVIFSNSGSEAVECALKLASLTTGRQKFLSFLNSYHGRTLGALSVSESFRQYTGPQLKDTVFVPLNDIDKCREVLSQGEIAAVIIEPIQGEGGIRKAHPQFLENLISVAHEHSTLVIVDEIQTGLGRSGKLVTNNRADILLFGKTLGGGLFPISATVFSSEKCGVISRDPVIHASSFAGSPISGAIAEQVTQIVTEPAFLQKIHAVENECKEFLEPLNKHRNIREIRGQGLMYGIEFHSPDIAGKVLLELIKRRVLAAFCLSAPQVLRIYPPATIESSDLARGFGLIEEAILAI